MTPEEFIERANLTDGDICKIDKLCFLWLEMKAHQWQKNGSIAIDALRIFKRLTEN